MTIVRIWRGITLATQAEQYLTYLKDIFVPACQTAEGNEGLCILKELQGELVHFLLLSFWISEEALSKFAGTGSMEVVNLSVEEKSLLIAFESTARHYKMVHVCASAFLDNKH